MGRTLYPPGPKPLLPGGNYIAFHRNPLSYLLRISKQYGDIAHWSLGSRHDYFINHPDLIKSVLCAQQPMDRSAPRLFKRMLGKGLFTSQGDIHKNHRTLLNPTFHTRMISIYANIMLDFANRTHLKWKDGQTVDISKEMSHLTLGILIKALFNSDIEHEAKEIGDAFDTIMAMMNKNNIPLFEDLMEKIPSHHRRQFNQARDRLDQTIFRMIQEGRAHGSQETEFLRILLHISEQGNPDFSDEEVRDEALTMFVAGHETIGNSLTWTWYLLAQHPDILHQLHNELDSVLHGKTPTPDDIPQLSYTKMVLQESLRLYPPAWIMARKPLDDFPLDDYIIPAKSRIFMSQYVMHHDPRFFPDPDKFDPLRWTKDSIVERPKFSYFPFGGGPRQCIGESFAMMEGILMIASLAQHWSLHLVPDHHVQLEPLLTLRPKHGIPMLLKSRKFQKFNSY